MNEIANVHNDLIDLPLRKFNASEIDILTAICYKCNEKQTNEVVLPLDEIKKLADYKNKNNETFLDDLKKTNSKLMALNFTIGTTKEFTQFVLFPTFEVSDSRGTLTVQVHEKFAYLLNNLNNCYTSLELQESSALKSSYSKGIYKKLREFRNSDKPFWKVTVDDFREYLDIPKSYRIVHIDERVLRPSIEELKPYFKGLTVEKYYKKKTGQRGRPRVGGFIFSFKGELKQSKEPIEPTQEGIAKVTGWRKTQFYCPDCHEPIFCKEFENENGPYTMYAHTDFKTGKCRYKTYDTADLLRIEHIQDIKVKEEPVTEEQIANKSRLANMLSKMFSKGE